MKSTFKTFNPTHRKSILALIVLMPLWVVLFVYLPINIRPAEDAAILYSYSENLADTSVISYNTNGEKAEGATDFFWMILLSILYKIGLPSYYAAVFLNLAAYLISFLLIVRILGFENNFYLQIITGLTFILSNQIFASIQGFSSNFFLLFIISAFYFYKTDKYFLFVLSFTFLCFVRPDGLLIAVPALLIDLFFYRKFLKKKLLLISLILVLPGLIYFIWRWNYFGMLLPLPMYVKSGADKVLFVVPATFKYIFHYLIFDVFILIAAIVYAKFILKEQSDRFLLMIIISMVVFPLMIYSSLTLSQNIGDRFMISVHFGLVISALYYLRNNYKNLIFFALLFLLFRVPDFIYQFSETAKISNEQMVDLALDLKKFHNGNLAVSEAGRLQYYSKWKTYDLLGLNTPEFARTEVDSGRLAKINPDLMVLHSGNDRYEYHFKYIDKPFLEKKDWNAMIQNSLKYGISTNKYQLMMVPFLGNSNEMLPKIGRLCENISSKLFLYAGSFPRYDIFLINKNYQDYSELNQLLISKYGAITIEEYFAKTKYWSSSNNMNKFFSD